MYKYKKTLHVDSMLAADKISICDAGNTFEEAQARMAELWVEEVRLRAAAPRSQVYTSYDLIGPDWKPVYAPLYDYVAKEAFSRGFSAMDILSHNRVRFGHVEYDRVAGGMRFVPKTSVVPTIHDLPPMLAKKPAFVSLGYEFSADVFPDLQMWLPSLDDVHNRLNALDGWYLDVEHVGTHYECRGSFPGEDKHTCETWPNGCYVVRAKLEE